MFSFRPLCDIILRRHNIFTPQLQRSVCTCQALFQHDHIPTGYDKDNIEGSLWFTTLPSKRKNSFKLAGTKKARKGATKQTGVLMISCKNKKLNHYSGTIHKKFDAIPLASKGWVNRKAKGDYFTFLPSITHPAFIVPKSEVQEIPLTFEETNLCPELIHLLKERGIIGPTNIQAKTIPAILSGQNNLVLAETGCGKTLAYLLPILQRVWKWKKIIPPANNAPLAVIVVPARELALQVGSVAADLCRELGLLCQTIVGGNTRELVENPELNEVDIVVASLGVFSKLTTFKHYKTHRCKHLVLDEADTLLDDSFNEKLGHFARRFPILDRSVSDVTKVPIGTQLTLVSATAPKSLEELLDGIVKPECLHRISTQYIHKVQGHVPQKFIRVLKSEKAIAMLKLVKSDCINNIPVMIFSNTCETVYFTHKFLESNGVENTMVVKKMLADTQRKNFRDFRAGIVNVLCCTDIAARGLDTTRVKHVINYDFPQFMASYIHRCGRTGRIGYEENCRITNLVSRGGEVKLVNEIETAARMQSELPNVNSNIKRILHYRHLRNEGLA